jgi:CMP/dCMP kinase
MIITIDGPTASGKSTIAQLLANKLSIYYLNSGLLYRGLAYILSQQGISIEKGAILTSKELMLLFSIDTFIYRYSKQKVELLYQTKDIKPYLKNSYIDQYASVIATNSVVRTLFLSYQRSYAQNRSLVVDGRDCGSTVFPYADYKFFLTASFTVRAHRWQKDQLDKGIILLLTDCENAVYERDSRDSLRVFDPLIIPKGAHIIDNSSITIDQTIDCMLASIIS